MHATLNATTQNSYLIIQADKSRPQLPSNPPVMVYLYYMPSLTTKGPIVWYVSVNQANQPRLYLPCRLSLPQATANHRAGAGRGYGGDYPVTCRDGGGGAGGANPSRRSQHAAGASESHKLGGK